MPIRVYAIRGYFTSASLFPPHLPEANNIDYLEFFLQKGWDILVMIGIRALWDGAACGVQCLVKIGAWRGSGVCLLCLQVGGGDSEVKDVQCILQDTFDPRVTRILEDRCLLTQLLESMCRYLHVTDKAWHNHPALPTIMHACTHTHTHT